MRWLSRDDILVNVAPGFIAPCLPSNALRVPNAAGWVYEIKHDGYRLMVRKAGDHVRIYTRRGVDWTKRFPRITEAVRKLKVASALLDGEGVICDDRGLAIFDKLHSKLHDESVMLYAFDVLELDGDDCRRERLDERKSRLRKLLRRRSDGILYSDHMDRDGDLVFEHACKFGCEGIVAKRADSTYRSGRSKSWLKIKNPKSPAMLRIEDGTF
jgi:bifunctional non-homologous end joining protein LigD